MRSSKKRWRRPQKRRPADFLEAGSASEIKESAFDVLWAMATRCDPEKSIEILKRCWSGALDVAIPPENRGLNSRALIDACKPYERRSDFPPVAESSDELKAKVREKWGDLIYG